MAPNAGRGRGAGACRGRSGGRGCGDGDMILSTTQQTSTHTSSLGEVSNDVVVENGGEDSSSEKLELDPNSLWFEHNKVTREITNCIQAYYKEPWRNWSEVDKDTKDQWFRLFKVNVHKQVMERLEDPEFKKRSEQAKKNKLSGVENGVIHPGHIQGSISTHEVAERLDDYEKKVAEYKEKGINKDPNEVYLEVVGGRKKGLVPGLGCSGDLWSKKSTSRTNNSSTTAYTPSLLSQLSSQLQQSQQQLEQSQQQANERMVELERKQAEYEKKCEQLEHERIAVERERIKSHQENQEEMRKFMEYIEVMKRQLVESSKGSKLCKSKHSTHSLDNEDPSSGGAPCAT
ncbi:hypothetical protein BVRB_2g036310 [Beta vulgaris subsp. vulgaris]|nr:hypothetical protein BVRB_2g036310 [Beta vulgaris subsp. vulgaris]